MPKVFTKRKQKWINHFKPDVLKGGALNPNIMTENRYYNRLAKLIEQMTAETHKEIHKLFSHEDVKEYFGQDIDVAAQAKIITNRLLRGFEGLFSLKSKIYADGLVRDADADSSRSLHMSLKELSGGLSLNTSLVPADMRPVLSATVTENVNLIRSIPQRYLNGVQQAVMRSITTGQGLKDLVPYLQKERGVTLRRARIIAEDQNRKAFSNISRIRMEKLGVQQFEWLHSRASLEPRKLHLHYNGLIFDFSDPPIIEEKTGERGFPGQAINCKCRMRPVVRFAGE